MSNYQQPNTANPVVPVDSSGRPLGLVTVQVENVLNPLAITTPVAKYNQPADHPAAPVTGQLSDAMGKSKKTFADGTMSST